MSVLHNIVVAPDRDTAIKGAGPYLAASYRMLGQWGLPRTIAGMPKDQWMGMEQRLVLRTIELLAERVLPLVAREIA